MYIDCTDLTNTIAGALSASAISEVFSSLVPLLRSMQRKRPARVLLNLYNLKDINRSSAITYISFILKGGGHIRREEQLTELIDAYQNLVFSICYKMTADYFAAEDLAQETFLSAYEHLKSFDGANAKAWICRIATNKCLDYMSASGRRSIPTEDVYLENDDKAAPAADTPESVYMENYMENEIKEMLLENCAKLRTPYNEIAKAYYYDEMDAAEIAKSRGVKLKTIQTQIYRARSMLRKIYRKENIA